MKEEPKIPDPHRVKQIVCDLLDQMVFEPEFIVALFALAITTARTLKAAQGQEQLDVYTRYSNLIAKKLDAHIRKIREAEEAA